MQIDEHYFYSSAGLQEIAKDISIFNSKNSIGNDSSLVSEENCQTT